MMLDLKSTLHSIIGGRELPGKGSVTSLNPATEEAVGRASMLDSESAWGAVEAAAEAYKAWSRTGWRERSELLARVLHLVVERAMDIAELITLETGKPIAEALLVDVFPACEALSWTIAKGRAYIKRLPIRPAQLLFKGWKAGYEFQPLGPVLVVTPWNYPFAIPMVELTQVLACGNTAILKPARATVLTGLLIGRLFEEAGAPPGVVNVVVAPGSATEKLIRRPVSKVLFTGSVDVGRLVAKKAAESLIPVQLELGGKDPAVVVSDADIEHTARGLVWGAFVNCGQTCASIERVYVESSVADKLIDRVVELAAAIRVGDPMAPDTDMGPLTTSEQRDLVDQHVQDALSSGARALTGGQRPEGRGYYYPPTVLVDVDDGMRVMREETFGPVMPIQVVDSLEEAVTKANASNFGLTASVWTQSRRLAERVAAELKAGVVTVNQHVVSFAEPTGAWGGVEDSGYGRSHGPLGLGELVNAKYVAEDYSFRPSSAWYYPYGRELKGFLENALSALYGKGIATRVKGLLRLSASRRFWHTVPIIPVLVGFKELFRRHRG